LDYDGDSVSGDTVVVVKDNETGKIEVKEIRDVD